MRSIMKDRESLFGRAEQYFKGGADELRRQIKEAGGVEKYLLIASAAVHQETGAIISPLRQLEEKLRGIK